MYTIRVNPIVTIFNPVKSYVKQNNKALGCADFGGRSSGSLNVKELMCLC